MRRFRFPLARLQRVRAHGERAARRELAAALADLASVEARLRVVEGSVASCRAESGSAIPLARALEEGLGRTAARLRAERDRAAGGVEEARARYRQRRRELQSLDRLEERQRRAWLVEAQRTEQAEVEELARAIRPRRRRA